MTRTEVAALATTRYVREETPRERSRWWWGLVEGICLGAVVALLWSHG